MSGRQGAGRRGGRDNASSNNDLELEYLNRILESLRKAKEFNDEQIRLGQEILSLEEDIKTGSASKSRSGSSPEQHRKLDDLYRKKLRNAEAEKKVHDEEDIVNNLAILATMRSTDEPAPTRGSGHGPKSRTKSQHRPIIESDVSAEGSGGVSPAETTGSTTGNPRVDALKRQKSHSQRSSSVISQGRPPISTNVSKEAAIANATKDTPTSAISESDNIHHRGILAERAGELKMGTEVFYKYSRTVHDEYGVGIQCIIKKIHLDKKPIVYDVQDPEPDASGKQSVHKATAKDLYPIPPAGKNESDKSGITFLPNTTVYARYPDTDTFYRAKVVRGLKGGDYTLRFEGEEDDTEKGVERRFVLDTRMR